MAHLLHIDSSIQGYRPVSRKLTARTAHAWRAAHPGGTVTYRDLGSNPLPHFDAATGLARLVPPELRNPGSGRLVGTDRGAGSAGRLTSL